MDLNELIRPALEAKAELEIEPLQTRLSHVKGLMDVYVGRVREDARHRVLKSMLAGIGQEPPSPPTGLSETTLELSKALQEVLASLGPIPEPPKPSIPEPPVILIAPKVVEAVELPPPSSRSRDVKMAAYALAKSQEIAALKEVEAPKVVVVGEPPPLSTDCPPESKQSIIPDWTALRKAADLGTILIVGNSKRVSERSNHFKERYALEPEWCLLDRGNPRNVDNLSARISSGKITGVVILEGFISHKFSNRIEDACYGSYVPYAFGGKGGVGEIREAFAELDRRLACMGAFGAETVKINGGRQPRINLKGQVIK
jgi:hypothetical protein